MAGIRSITIAEVKERAFALADQPEQLLEFLRHSLPLLRGPSINGFTPAAGHAGTMLDISGHNFADARADNQVVVGGKPATVVAASATNLKVITDPWTTSGPVMVTVGGHTAT